MSDELIIASTTDTPAEIKAAMVHGIEAQPDDVLSVEEPEPVEAPVAEEKADDAPPAEKVEAEKEPEEKPVEKKTDAEDLGGRAQKRINKLVAEREAERRRADDAEAKAKSLEDGQKKPADKTVETAGKSGTEVDAAWVAANPQPQQEDFADYDTFVKGWTKWEMDRREGISVRKAEEAGRAAAQKVLDDKAAKDVADAAQTERTEAFQRFEATKEDARARYPDFDAVMTAAKDLKVSGPMSYVLMDSVVGHDIGYWLATHPEEAADLAELEGPEAIRELGRLERTVELQVAARAQKKEPVADVVVPKKATKAPAPIAPVGGRSANTTVDLNDPNMDQQEWKRRRNAQDLARRQRR